MSNNDNRRDDSAAASVAALSTVQDRAADEHARTDPDTIRLLAEEVSVDREQVETGRVRVRVVTRERDEMVDMPLASTRVEVEHVAIGRPITERPPIRRENDTTIVPVVEEIVVVERRLMLREELHIRTVQTTERHQERVVLRRQEALVTHLPVESPAADDRPSAGVEDNATRRKATMAYETIVAVFDTAEHARAAAAALKGGGFHDEDISILDESRLGSSTSDANTKDVGMWGRLFGGDVAKHEADVYGRTVAGGGTVVSVRVPDNEVAHATGILELHHPIDVNDRAVTSGIAPKAHVDSVAKATTATPMAPQQAVAVSPKLAEAHDEVLRLAEEQLQVGKERIETGRTRVRRFTTEREVAQDVTLHEEHAEVLRRAVTDSATLGDVDWSDSEIEVTETAEHALVKKTARVVEEVALKTVGTDHVETLHEKLRRQQAEVVRVDADGRPIAQGQQGTATITGSSSGQRGV